MARAKIQMPEELLKKLSQLGKCTDEIADRVLQAGGEVVLDKVRDNLSAVVGQGTKYKSRSTGELEQALGLAPMKLDKNGNYNVKVGFSEPHPGGVSNAKLAAILEYGKHGQPPKPFLAPAKTASRSACIKAMRVTLEAEVEKL